MSELAPFRAPIDVYVDEKLYAVIRRIITHKLGVPYALYQGKRYELWGVTRDTSIRYSIFLYSQNSF